MIRSILRSLAAAGALPLLALVPATALAGAATSLAGPAAALAHPATGLARSVPDAACLVKPHPAGQAAYQLPGGALPGRYLLVVPSRYDAPGPRRGVPSVP